MPGPHKDQDAPKEIAIEDIVIDVVREVLNTKRQQF